MVIGATTVFTQMQRSMNAIWDVMPRPSRSTIKALIKSRLLSLTVVISLGFVLLVSLLLNVAVHSLLVFAENWLPIPAGIVVVIEMLVALLVIALLFATMFRVLPDVLLKWKDVALAAIVTAVLFSLGRAPDWPLSGSHRHRLYLWSRRLTGGAANVGILSSMILLFGAAFCRAHCEARVPAHPAALAPPSAFAGNKSIWIRTHNPYLLFWRRFVSLRVLFSATLLGAFSLPALALEPQDFDLCVGELRQQALDAGLPAQVVSQHLDDIQLNEKVIELDRSQPEFTSSFADYFTRRVSDTRIETGRQKYREQQALLRALTKEYGIPGHYLVAFWGLETNYGGYLGYIPTSGCPGHAHLRRAPRRLFPRRAVQCPAHPASR